MTNCSTFTPSPHKLGRAQVRPVAPIACLALLAVAAGLAGPAHAQLADHVVINEIELNPEGSDAASIAEWIELYNPTGEAVDLRGWVIAPGQSYKAMTIPPGIVLPPGQPVLLFHEKLWFSDIGETVELRSPDGTVVDRTPVLYDRDDDRSTWQRLYDGYGGDSAADWKFAVASAGASNGRLVVDEAADEGLVLRMSVDKAFYLFGEEMTISGNVTEVPLNSVGAAPEPVRISITGPGYADELTLQPDRNMAFEAKVRLYRVLGITGGDYGISATYHDASASAAFAVGSRAPEAEVAEERTLVITTDRPEYLPGQKVQVTAVASRASPSDGLRFEVLDPSGARIESGNLFSAGDTFETGIFLSTVRPSYGTHVISASHAGVEGTASFEVVDPGANPNTGTNIRLEADKQAYMPGETVHVTGRTDGRLLSVDLSVTQTKQHPTTGIRPLDNKWTIPVLDDGTFEHTFRMPGGTDGLGFYVIRASEWVGSREIVVHGVEDPASFRAATEPLSLIIGGGPYAHGDVIRIGGQVRDVQTAEEALLDPDGGKVSIRITAWNGVFLTEEDGTPGGTGLSPYEFTRTPDRAGNYAVETKVTDKRFKEGQYKVTAKYGRHTATAEFSVEDIFKGSDTLVGLDRDVYGLGDKVTLTGKLKLEPLGDPEVRLKLTDGTVETFVIPKSGQQFEWTWDVPSTPTTFTGRSVSSGDATASTYGIYVVSVRMDEFEEVLRFKVSENPEADSLPPAGIAVSTDKDAYEPGERVRITGAVDTLKQIRDDLMTGVDISIRKVFPTLTVYTSAPVPGSDGGFADEVVATGTVEVGEGDDVERIPRFDDGMYILRAAYDGNTAVTVFSVGIDTSGTDISVARSEYAPGSSVGVTGSGWPYPGRVDVVLIAESETGSICGTTICGSPVGIKHAVRSDSGSVRHTVDLPENARESRYEVLASSGTVLKSAVFEVSGDAVEPPAVTLVDKGPRQTESDISITASSRVHEGSTVLPRVVSGSLISARGDAGAVNVSLLSPGGSCIIGQDEGCLVSGSTRAPGRIHEEVEADGMSLKVRYSGPDARVERFSVQPAGDGPLPDADWKVVILKDGEPSRFQYKVTYRSG